MPHGAPRCATGGVISRVRRSLATLNGAAVGVGVGVGVGVEGAVGDGSGVGVGVGPGVDSGVGTAHATSSPAAIVIANSFKA